MRIVAAQVSLNASTSTSLRTTEVVQARAWSSENGADAVRITNEARASARSQSRSAASLQVQPVGSWAVTEGTGQPPTGLGPMTGSDNPRERDLTAVVSEGVDKPPNRESVAASDDSELLGSAEGTKLLVLRRIIEAMTGRKIRLLKPTDPNSSTSVPSGDAEPREPTQTAASAATSTTQGTARAGWGLELQIERTQVQSTAVNFSAQGSIVTEDGRAIQFDAAFVKQGTAVSVEKLSLREGDAQLKDPLVLLYSGTHAELSEAVQQFDLDANGQPVPLRAVTNGAYIVRDLNHNGKVDDGREMLGAISGDGFADLRGMDDDDNGFVDSGDRAFGSLALWQPSPSGDGELIELAVANIGGLHTGNLATTFELRAGPLGALQARVRTTGIYLSETGEVRPLEQLDLKI